MIAFVLFCLPLLPLSALEVRTIVGLGGAFEVGRWLPIRVAITSSEELDGMLSVSLREGAVFGEPQSTVVYETRAVQARDSTRDYPFVIPSDTAQPLQITVSSGGRSLYSGAVDIRRFATGSRLVLGLSRRPSLDFLMGMPSGDPEAPFRVVYPLPEALPEKWLGYDGVDLVVIHDIPGGLDDRQIESIDRWVSAGGTLVVSGGAVLSSTDARRLGALLPVRVLGLATLRDLSVLARYSGKPITDPAPLLVTRALVERGSVLLAEGDLPLIVKERHGNGSIYFFAFDYAQPPLDGWAGEAGLWRSILAELPDRSGRYSDFTIPDTFAEMHRAQTQGRRALAPVGRLLSLEQLPLPTLAASAVLLALFCFGAAALAVVRPGRFGRLRFVALTLFGVLTATLFWFLLGANRRVTGPILYTLSRVEAGNGSFGLVSESLFLAAPYASHFELAVHGTQTAVVQRTGDNLRLRETPTGTTIEDLFLDRWSYRNLTILSMRRFPVTSSVTLADFRLTARVHNGSAEPFREGYFIYHGVPYSSGPLAPDATAVRSFPYDPGTGDASNETDWESRVRDERAIIILDYLRSNPAFGAMRDGNAVVFVGLMDRSPIDITTDPVISHERGINVVMAVMQLEQT